MLNATKQGMNKMKNDGFTFTDLTFKNPLSFIYDERLRIYLIWQLKKKKNLKQKIYGWQI